MNSMNREDMKPPRSLDDQVDLLESRGLVVPNKTRAKMLLQQTNYYRLSAYGLEFRDDENRFIANTSIETMYSIYCFDEDLRHLLFGVIEPIEVRLRAELSYHLAIKYGNVAHLSSAITVDKSQFFKFLSSYYTEIDRKKKTAFVAHHITEYGELPVWVAVELLTFGSLSMYYSNLILEDRTLIANSFGIDVSRLPGWFECLCEIRNICAHNGRIYNRALSKSPKMYTEFEKYKGNKVFQVLVIIRQIYHGKGIKWQNFYDNLKKIINLHGRDLNLSLMEFPSNWENILSPK